MALFSLPYQLSPRADRVTLRWLVERGDATGALECEYGRPGPVRKRSLAVLGCDVCEQSIAGLRPGQRVRYRLRHPAGATAWYSVRTLPQPDAPVRALLTSDAQS
ncbi:MAG TPA: hypothetical protein VFK80_00360, partial [Limnochordia bacterium]|nr:hypothetical protein [Limnochordia bacterium]